MQHPGSYPGCYPGDVRVPTGSFPKPRNHISIEERVRKHIVDCIPTDTYRCSDVAAPFKWDTSIPKIINTLLPYATGGWSNAVYVLECLQTPTNPGVLVQQGVSNTSIQEYQTAWQSRRIVYVGRSRNLHRRIHEHLNEQGEAGAYFTAMYPPVRILQVGWFPHNIVAKAERLTQKLLQERFPEDFIAQPG